VSRICSGANAGSQNAIASVSPCTTPAFVVAPFSIDTAGGATPRATAHSANIPSAACAMTAATVRASAIVLGLNP
jgi:hypothetical protein